MASLPRNHPTRFYDIVIQVGIIRPGPIVGNLANPYFERRNGRQPVVYPHPSLEPILERTLGVPIFQEQLLRVAMVAAGFTGGEAEELRRAMGSKRSVERMNAIVEKLRRGMTERGITGKPQDEIVQGITSFALYGFPESHAASFALIAYASAYLKAHHPTAFYLGLLNAWPMGFYHPATLVKDAQRHGVEVRPVDVQSSGVHCRWEDRELREGERDPRTGRRRRPAPSASASGSCAGCAAGRRCRSRPSGRRRRSPTPRTWCGAATCTRTSSRPWPPVGALACFGLTRRAALWQVARLGQAGRPAARPPAGPRALAAAGDDARSRRPWRTTGASSSPWARTR